MAECAAPADQAKIDSIEVDVADSTFLWGVNASPDNDMIEIRQLKRLADRQLHLALAHDK